MLRQSILISFFLLLAITQSVAQISTNKTAIFQKAILLEKQFKDEEALDIYQKLYVQDSSNIYVFSKLIQCLCSIGSIKSTTAKKNFYNKAYELTEQGKNRFFNNAEWYYLKALCCGKKIEVTTDKSIIVQQVKLIKDNAEKALTLNNKHSMAYYILGRWHYEIEALNWAKKLAIKTFYGGLPEASLNQAINYFNTSLQNNNNNALSLFMLGKVYYKKENYPLANKYWQILTKLEPVNTYEQKCIMEAKQLLNNIK